MATGNVNTFPVLIKTTAALLFVPACACSPLLNSKRTHCFWCNVFKLYTPGDFIGAITDNQCIHTFIGAGKIIVLVHFNKLAPGKEIIYRHTIRGF